MKRKEKTTQTKIEGTEESASLYLVSRILLTKMAEKYDVPRNKLLIGMQYGQMFIQVYDEGAHPVRQTLEIITLPETIEA